MLDGVVLARKTGAGALRRPVLVALGLRPDGKKEIIDFRLAASESAAEWEKFLTDLYRHGLTGEGLDMVCVDGGRGLLAALPIVLHGIPVQRCWAHKIRNIPARPTSPSQARTPQGRTPQGHACSQSTCRALGRSSVRRSLRGRATPMRLHACATTSTNCSPASVTNPRSNVEGTNHQRHRTTLPRSPATD
jgi:hypothetical protein